MERNTTPVKGPMEILIVTHAKDMPWLQLCMESIERFCTGFQGVTIAHPVHQLEIFKQAALDFDWHCRLYAYEEVPGKGMIQHMVKMAEADLIVPPETKWVLTCDADCIFTMPTRPEDYFANGKPYYLVRTWDSLTAQDPDNPGAKVVSDCYQWREPTAKQLGFDPAMYTMCMNTNVFPVEFFGHYRAHIEKMHQQPFAQWMLSGRNEFPQDRMDFTAMGAWAWQYMHEYWTWIDVDKQPYPADRKRAYWSHGGVTPAIRKEIEGLLSR